MRALPHIRKLDDCFSDFNVEIKCSCGHYQLLAPEPLQEVFGESATLDSVKARMKCSKCGKKDSEVVARAKPRPRGHHTH